jgi:endonuclease-3 related protein
MLRPIQRKLAMNRIQLIYHRLFDHYGPQNWWPAESPFEMAVGAILVQNTNWVNVEKAIANLIAANTLDCKSILALERGELEKLIRPSGFFRQKAQRLQLFCAHLREFHQGQIEILAAQSLDIAREELLVLKGIGPETADSILLYAGQQPSFVVDAYTNRLFQRLGLLNGTEKYEQVRTLFMNELPADVVLYNEYHALIVIHCKEFCRKKPLCAGCPCTDLCRYRKEP